MPMILKNPRLKWILVLLLAAWCMVSPARVLASGAPEPPKPDAEAPHGAEEPEEGAAEGDGGGHGAPEASQPEPEKVFKLAEPLGNRFDLSTLRAGVKTHELRYPLNMISSSVPAAGNRNMRVSISLVLEFGSETGMAEVEIRNEEIIDTIRKIISRYSAEELATTDGKLRLKEMIVLNLNRRMTTANLRQVYYMTFHIAPNR